MASGRERLYSWDDKSMYWYRNAVEYRSFHREVADFMLEDLPERPSVCDVGCGIGALTLQLVSRCSRITAIDLNAKPADYLRKLAAERSLDTVDVITGDFLQLDAPEKKYDGLVLCLAGGVERFLEPAARWSDTLFFVENATNHRSFSSVGRQTKEMYYNEDLKLLQAMDVRHSYRFFNAPFGQVFTDRADAEAFMRHYNKGESETSIQAALEARLQPLDHPKYKLFMPNEKPLLMITVRLA